MNTAPTIQQINPSLSINYGDPKLLTTLKNMVGGNVTEPEFELFIQYAMATRLNPITKEIWCIKTKDYTTNSGFKVDGKLQIMTGIAGFYKIANSHSQFNGCDETEYHLDNKGDLEYAVCRAYRKDRDRPSVGIAYWKEYAPEKNDKNKNSIWFQKPHYMLGKCAESNALKKLFPNELGHFAEPAEYDKMGEAIDVTPTKAQEVVAPEYKDRWFYVPTASAKQIESLEKAGCKEYKTFEVDKSTGVEIEMRGFWKTTIALDPTFAGKLEKYSTDAPDGALEVTGEATNG